MKAAAPKEAFRLLGAVAFFRLFAIMKVDIC